MRPALLPLFLMLLLPPLLGGCLSVAKTIVTAPVKLGEMVYDTATESQEEADIKRGRALRKQEEADRRAAKKAEKERRKAEREQRPYD
jgi:hypothetical protein